MLLMFDDVHQFRISESTSYACSNEANRSQEYRRQTIDHPDLRTAAGQVNMGLAILQGGVHLVPQVAAYPGASVAVSLSLSPSS